MMSVDEMVNKGLLSPDVIVRLKEFAEENKMDPEEAAIFLVVEGIKNLASKNH